MTTWFVSRHRGAIEWAAQNGIRYDTLVSHLDPSQIIEGDTVIGTLPIHIAAEICAQGATYLNLSVRVAPADRERELTAQELVDYHATIERYDVRRVP